MVFVAFTSDETDSGEPTKQSLFKKAKDNFDDHESRLSAVEAVANNFNPLTFHVARTTGVDLIREGVGYLRSFKDAIVVGVRLQVWDAGTAGTLSVDVQKKRGAGAFSSILSGDISVAFGAGSFAVGTGTITDTDMDAGDIYRLDVSGVQTGASGFNVFIEFEGA